MWIPLEANLGLGSLRSKAAPTTSSVFLNRHKVILHPSLYYRTDFDATRGPWMGSCWDLFCISATTGKCFHPRNPSWSAIERMARYRPIDFLGRKKDEPSMAENWLERTERMLV